MTDDELLRAARILIVEDDDFIGMMYAESLAEMGHGVCAVVTTEQGAVAAAAKYGPDFLIVDGSLAEGSGTAAVAEILRGGFVPHLFVSGNAAEIAALVPGASILEKPFRVAELGRAVQRTLRASLAVE